MVVDAPFRTVYTSFWTDSKVGKMSFFEKGVFQYLMTCPFSNVSCCFEISIIQASTQLSLDAETVIDILCSLRDTWKVIDFDEYNSEVIICNRGKYSWNTEWGSFSEMSKSCKNIKNKTMKSYIEYMVKYKFDRDNWDDSVCNYYTGTWKNGFIPDTLSIGSTIEQEQVEVKENNKKGRKPRNNKNDPLVKSIDELKDETKNKGNFEFYINSLNMSETVKGALINYYYTVKRYFNLGQVKMQIEKLNGFTENEILEAINNSTMRDYSGFYPKKSYTNYKNNKVPVKNNFIKNSTELGEFKEY